MNENRCPPWARICNKKVFYIIEDLLEVIDDWTFETRLHSFRSTFLSLQIGKSMGFGPVDLFTLGVGSILHDIGKLEIPREILMKPGSLTPEEWVIMRQHPELGGKILNRLPMLRFAKELVLQHQERWDGSGYPLGLKEEEISLNARIFAVSDSFDAMTSQRSYNNVKSVDEAYADLSANSGILYDPIVVEHCLLIIDTNSQENPLINEEFIEILYFPEKFFPWFIRQFVDGNHFPSEE